MNREPDDNVKKNMLADHRRNRVCDEKPCVHRQWTVETSNKREPIGLAFTDDVAQVFMCWWDNEFIRRMAIKEMRVWCLYQQRQEVS